MQRHKFIFKRNCTKKKINLMLTDAFKMLITFFFNILRNSFGDSNVFIFVYTKRHLESFQFIFTNRIVIQETCEKCPHSM